VSDFAELLADPEIHAQYAALTLEQRASFDWRARWLMAAHKHQIEPSGDWWSIWLMCAGRGAGKTRAAAENIAWWAWEQPGTRWLVSAPTSADLRGTCFEGDSGLLAVIPPVLVSKYNSTLHELTLTNGSLIKGIPASEPERFRGPQFHGAWCCLPGTLILLPDGSEVAIETIAPGEMVMTRHGARMVTAAGLSGNPNELVAIEYGDTSLTVTADHPILVGDRWIPAGELQQGDMLCQVTNTSAGATRTGSSTSAASGQSHRGGSSTTRTRTKATTTPATCKPCHEAITSGYTLRAYLQQPGKKLLLRPRWLAYAPRKLRAACTAAATLCRTLLVPWVSSAPSNAPSSGDATSLCPSSASAMCAPTSTPPLSSSRGTAAGAVTPSLRPARIELTQRVVSSVARSPNAPTYSLTVEGEHEFIANGIVVHNCDELAAWEYLQEAWDMIQFGIRLGQRTKLIASTTPKPKPVVMDLIDREGDDVAVSRASTHSNIANLAPSFKKQIMQYEGTKLGRQEIYAEIIDPEEGGIVSRDWFKLWPNGRAFPKFEYIVQSLDCATSEKTINDPTAHITFGVFKPEDGGMCAMVIDCWQDHLQYPDLRPRVLDEYETVYGDGREKKRVDLLLIEDKSAGISLIQDLQRAGVPVQAYNPGRADKVQRMSIVANIIKAGRVWIPESGTRKGFVRDWAEGMVSQVCSFPGGSTHDDFVDAMSQALRYLRDAGWLTIDFPTEWVDDSDYADANPQRKTNPYDC
jgi:predicted phage terminase large subunit-like protein